MPGPTLGSGRTFEGPPMDLQNTNPELYQYLFLLHARIFGIGGGTKGDLDLDNINPEILPDVTAEQAATHTSLFQGAAVESFAEDEEVTASTVSVDFSDMPGSTHPTIEDNINELKADLNSLITEYNVAVGVVNDIMERLNALLTALRAGNLIAE